MALPVIEAPKYHLTIPSNGQSIEYRPFLVKEEKILLIAQEANTQSSIISAMKDIIKACTFNEVDLYKLTMTDLEYILLNIRARSVGESSSIRVKCSECDHYNSVEIDLTSINVIEGTTKESNVKLTETVGVTLKSPGLKDVERSSKSKGSNQFSDAITSVIESIYDENQVYPLDNATPKEVDDFVDSLSTEQVLKIQNWVDSLPRLEHVVTFVCEKCGHENTVTLKGLNDFFE